VSCAEQRTGVDFSYGNGQNLAGLEKHKADREARGECARGELGAIAEVAQGLDQEREGEASAQAAERAEPNDSLGPTSRAGAPSRATRGARSRALHEKFLHPSISMRMM
jgi:hypothetical protein